MWPGCCWSAGWCLLDRLSAGRSWAGRPEQKKMIRLFLWDRYLPANEAVLSRKRRELQESHIGPPSRLPPHLKTPPGDVDPILLITFTFQKSKNINQIYFVVHQLHLHRESSVTLLVLGSWKVWGIFQFCKKMGKNWRGKGKTRFELKGETLGWAWMDLINLWPSRSVAPQWKTP